MKIPTAFHLMGQKITVKYDSGLFYCDDRHAVASYRTGEIIVQPAVDGAPKLQSAVEQAFCHEMIHHILYLAGEDAFDPPLHKREYLVDRIAGLLHQALTTMEYGED